MANTSYELGWKTFLKCKECWEFKELCSDNWYKHKEWYLWVLWRCKECIKAWRKTERELKMARIRDKKRYHSEKRQSWIKKYTEENYDVIKKRKELWYKNNPERIVLYNVYKHARERCTDPNNPRYHRYWWRWIKFLRKSFDDFYNDMLPSYIEHIKGYWAGRKNTQIDRINNNWNYCKENCRWVTCKENNPHNHFREVGS